MIHQLHPWYWRSLPLDGRTGADVFAALFRPSCHLALTLPPNTDARGMLLDSMGAEHARAIATLLESPSPQPNAQSHSRYSICAGPPRIIDGRLQLWTPQLGHILDCLHQRLASRPPAPTDPQPPNSLPFLGGWLGWLGYDLAWEIEALPTRTADPLPFPVAYWYEPEAFAVLDHGQQQLWLAASQPEQLDPLIDRLHQDVPVTPVPSPLPPVSPTQMLITQQDYEAMVRQAQRHIRAGDIFQANLSLRFQAQTDLNPWQLYQQLHRINPSPFASYWQTPWGAVVSCSPERLVQLQGRQAQTRPIAGTRSRGTTPEADRALAHTLKTHPKELAEHIMLVDLERNDLGRVCDWGSVQVDEFLTLEYYSHVMHLVSNVIGTLAAHHNPIDLIRAVFPGGTITGCPKVRCLEIIDTLEPWRRNLFYGSCGYLDYRGHLDLNILIRTLLVTPVAARGPLPSHWWHQPTCAVNLWGQVGAGIVADSQPQQEWQESWHKAQAQLTALQQITTPTS